MKTIFLFIVMTFILPMGFAQETYKKHVFTPNMSLQSNNVYPVDILRNYNLGQRDNNPLAGDDFDSGIVVYASACEKLPLQLVFTEICLNYRQDFVFKKRASHFDLCLTSLRRKPQYSLSLWKKRHKAHEQSGLSIVKSPVNPVAEPPVDSTDNSNTVDTQQKKRSDCSKHQSGFSVVDIVRNSGGKQAEGRLPTAYSESMSKQVYLSPALDIARNSEGKHGEGRLPTLHTMSLGDRPSYKPTTDIARNSGGRNGE